MALPPSCVNVCSTIITIQSTLYLTTYLHTHHQFIRTVCTAGKTHQNPRHRQRQAEMGVKMKMKNQPSLDLRQCGVRRGDAHHLVVRLLRLRHSRLKHPPFLPAPRPHLNEQTLWLQTRGLAVLVCSCLRKISKTLTPSHAGLPFSDLPC